MNTVRKGPIPIPIPHPLWRLEMLREQAERRFQRTEAEHRAATRELEEIRKLIELRRLEAKW